MYDPPAMLCSRSFILLLIGGLKAIWGGEESNEKVTDEIRAREWLREFDQKLEKIIFDSVEANWNFSVNLTEENNLLDKAASMRRSQFLKDAYANASRFDWRNFKDQDLVRQFSKATDIELAVLPDEDIKQLDSHRGKMQFIYSTAEICEKRPTKLGEKSDNASKCIPQNPDLTRIVATSRNWKEQLWAWKSWRDVTGKLMKPYFVETVRLVNKAAQMHGYRDNGEYWQSMYEMDGFASACEQLWQQVRPLYQHLHAYVRRKLMQNYPDNLQNFPSTRQIPAHILGNIWAQTWNNIVDMVIPYKDSPALDITQILKDKGFDVPRMFRESESFFTSLGLHPMPEEFWNKSLLEKPTDGRKVVCHASAWDFYNKRDFRIKQCTDVTGEYFFTTHHEMGHVQYYLLYKDQPIIYRRGANPGFHEAVGDVMSLSVDTPEHLQKIGLLKETPSSKESQINFLMKQALQKIAFIPYAYMIDRWRWGVFDGTTPPENYNRDYWKLRCKLQGVSPPVPRSEEDFDPGAKYHVAQSTPYIRYFVSYIIQFQFHKSLCEAAGHVGPLHKCDIYNSTAAGDKLREMFSLGSSKPWPDVMEVLTGQRDMDAGPLLTYFKPLRDWLEVENRGYDISWDEDCHQGAILSNVALVVLPSIALILFSLGLALRI